MKKRNSILIMFAMMLMFSVTITAEEWGEEEVIRTEQGYDWDPPRLVEQENGDLYLGTNGYIENSTYLYKSSDHFKTFDGNRQFVYNPEDRGRGSFVGTDKNNVVYVMSFGRDGATSRYEPGFSAFDVTSWPPVRTGYYALREVFNQDISRLMFMTSENGYSLLLNGGYSGWLFSPDARPIKAGTTYGPDIVTIGQGVNGGEIQCLIDTGSSLESWEIDAAGLRTNNWALAYTGINLQDYLISDDGAIHITYRLGTGYDFRYAKIVNGAYVVKDEKLNNDISYTYRVVPKLVTDGTGEAMVYYAWSSTSYGKFFLGDTTNTMEYSKKIGSTWSLLTHTITGGDILTFDSMSHVDLKNDAVTPVFIFGDDTLRDAIATFKVVGLWKPLVKLFAPALSSNSYTSNSISVGVTDSASNVGGTPYYKFLLYESNGTTLLQGTGLSTTKTKTFTGLSANQKYDVVVQTCESDGTVHATTKILNDRNTKALAPTFTSATTTSTANTNMSIKIAEAANSLETYYDIRVYDGATLTWTSGKQTATTVTATGMQWNESFSVSVLTYNVNSVLSSTASIGTFQTRSATPSSVTITDKTQTSMKVNITDSTSNQDAETHYYRAYLGGTTTTIKNSGWTTATSYNFTGLLPNETYDIRVYTGNVGPTISSYETYYTKSTLAYKPSISVGTRTNQGFKTTLTTDSRNVNATTHRTLVYSSTRGTLLKDTGFTSSLTSTFTGLSPNNKYDIRVQTRNAYGELSSDDWLVNDTYTLAKGPSGVVINSITSSSFKTNITTDSSNSLTTKYVVKVWNSGRTAVAYTSPLSTSTAVTATGLEANQLYDVQILTYTVDNVYSASAFYTDNTNTLAKPPTASISNVTNNGFKITLNESASNRAETNYRVYVKNSTQTVTYYDSSYTSATSFTVTGLTPNNKFDVVVQTYNSVGALSSTGTLVNDTLDLAVKPSSVSTSSVTNSGFTVNINENSSNVLDTKYAVEVWNADRTVKISTTPVSSATTVAITGLLSNNQYDLKILTYNYNNVLSSSDWFVDNIATLAIKPTASVSNVTNNGFKITLNESSSNQKETYYRVYVKDSTGVTTLYDSTYTNSTSLTVSGLTPNTKFDVVVKTYNVSGVLSSTDTLINDTLDLAVKPTLATVSSLTTSGFTVSLTESSSNVLDTKYAMELWNSDRTVKYETTSISSSTTGSFTLLSNKAYDVKVLTYNYNNVLSSSDWFIDNKRTIAKPPASTSITNRTTTSMKFNIVDNAETTDTTYSVLKVYDETRTTLVKTIALTSSKSISITGLEVNASYDFYLETYNADSVLSASGWYQDNTATLALPPTSVSVNSITDSGFSINISENSGNTEETYYKVNVYREDTMGTVVATSASGVNTSRTLTGMNPNTGYDVYILTYSSEGVLSSTDKLVDSAVTLGEGPVSASVTARTRDSLTVKLVESSNNINETYYIYKVYSGAALVSTSPLTSATTYVCAGLSNAETYSVNIETYNSDSAISNSAQFITNELTDSGIPGYTTQLGYVDLAINLTDSSSNTLGTTYLVELKNSSSVVVDSITRTSGGEFKFTGLPSGTTYTIKASYKTTGLSSYQYSIVTPNLVTKVAAPPIEVTSVTTMSTATYTIYKDPGNDPTLRYFINGVESLSFTGLLSAKSYPTVVTIKTSDGIALAGSHTYDPAITESAIPDVTISALGSTITIAGIKNPANELATEYEIVAVELGTNKYYTTNFTSDYSGLSAAAKYNFQVRYRTEGNTDYQSTVISLSETTGAEPPTVNTSVDGTDIDVLVYNNINNALNIECEFAIYEVDGTLIEIVDGGLTKTFSGLDILTEYEVRVKYRTIGAPVYQSDIISKQVFTEGPETPEIRLSNLGAETAFSPLVFVIDSEETTMVNEDTTLAEWNYVTPMISEMRYYIGPSLTTDTDLLANYTPIVVHDQSDYINDMIKVSGSYAVYIEVDTVTGETLTDYEPVVRLILIADQDTIGMDGTAMYEFNYTILRRISDDLVVPHNVLNVSNVKYVDGLIYVSGDTTAIYDTNLILVTTFVEAFNDICEYDSEVYIAMNSGLYTYESTALTSITALKTTALENGYGILYAGEGLNLVGYIDDFSTPEFTLVTGKTLIAIRLIGSDLYLFSDDGFVGTAN